MSNNRNSAATLIDSADAIAAAIADKGPLGGGAPSSSPANPIISEKPAQTPPPPQPFSAGFFDKTPEATRARKAYFKFVGSGAVLIMITIFTVFAIYWGALWKTTPRIHNLQGWVVDFDGGAIGETVLQTLPKFQGTHFVTWQIKNVSQFPNGPADLAFAVVDEQCQVAISINPQATAKLTQALATGDASYNGSLAVTGYGNEARNENVYRAFVRANVDSILQAAAISYAHQQALQLSTASNVSTLLINAPQLITQPLYYTIDNLRPFDTSLATAVTFVGLIYLLICAFIIANVSAAARMGTGLERKLTLSSLIRLRLATPVIIYFFVSFAYTLLNQAFKLPFHHNFGNSGFLVFWALQFFGLLALGLALEAMITILTPRFIPFFMLLWIIANTSVCVLPIEVLPEFYRYGHAGPFYNIAMSVRTIVFSTKNNVGLNFGVLIVWATISCITIPLFVWFNRRQAILAMQKQRAAAAQS